MATTEHHSLLGLPAELRVRIYRHLFQDSDTTTIRVTMFTEWSTEENDLHIDLCKPTEANNTSIDTGLTLTCRLLRGESLPVLQQNLTLSCILDAEFQGPGMFNIKPQYIKSIRKADFLFKGDSWAIPYKGLTSLEEIYFEYSGSEAPLNLAIGTDTFFEWATASDVKKLVGAVKEVLWPTNFSNAKMDAVLEDENRGFKIVCRDYFESPVNDCARWLTFDWDTLYVLDGLADIYLEFRETLRDRTDEDRAAMGWPQDLNSSQQATIESSDAGDG